MSDRIEKIKNMTYPGRVIIIGKDRTDHFIITIYAVTGRSPSSQARKMEYSQKQIFVKPAEKEKLKKGNTDLLIYPAVKIGKGIAVSNGKQTEDIYKNIKSLSNPIKVMAEALKSWDYEPDPPHFTPRINGCVLEGGRAALGIIKRAEDKSSLKNFYEFPLIPGKGKLISTYEGENTDPLPSFSGEPIEIEIPTTNVNETAHYIYHSLGPSVNQPDYRVSLACIFSLKSKLHQIEYSIINQHERKAS